MKTPNPSRRKQLLCLPPSLSRVLSFFGPLTPLSGECPLSFSFHFGHPRSRSRTRSHTHSHTLAVTLFFSLTLSSKHCRFSHSFLCSSDCLNLIYSPLTLCFLVDASSATHLSSERRKLSHGSGVAHEQFILVCLSWTEEDSNLFTCFIHFDWISNIVLTLSLLMYLHFLFIILSC